jgi:hypothetical protein
LGYHEAKSGTTLSLAQQKHRYRQRLLPVILRISKIVNTTPKVIVAAVNVNTRYPGQVNPNEILSIPAATDAVNVATKHANPDALAGLPAF